MAVLSFIFFGFLGIVAVIGCIRAGKLVLKLINKLFDTIEDKLG